MHSKVAIAGRSAYIAPHGKVKHGGCNGRGQRQKIAELWSGAMIFAPHLAGCSCAGFHVPLDPAAVEEDLLDFLAYRYKGEGRTALASFVSARIAERSHAIWRMAGSARCSPA